MSRRYIPDYLQRTIGCLLLFTLSACAVDLPQIGHTTHISLFGSYPCWSPDSRCIAFSATNSPGIWIYDRTTGTTRHIYSLGNFPAWSPKGDRIAFWIKPHLWLIRPDGTEPVDTGVVLGSGIHWSPDAKHLTAHDTQYGPHDQVLLFDTGTWARTELDFARIGPRRKIGDCSWTPDGNLLFTPPVGATDAWQSNEVREYTPAGQLIARTLLHGFDAKPFDANISPDGRFVLFHRGSRGIWIATRDGRTAKHILPIGAAAVWSPDGRSMAYDDSSSDPRTKDGVFIADLKP
jgi:Tol biopolymer transport system component